MLSLLGIMIPYAAFAAPLTYKSDTLTNQTKSEAATHTVDFLIPGDMMTGFTITFPAGFDLGDIDYTDMSLEYSDDGQTSCPAASYTNSYLLAATANLTKFGVAVSGQVVTFSPPIGPFPPFIPAESCIKITLGDSTVGFTQIKNPGTAGDYIIELNIPNGGNAMSGNLAVAIIDDDEVIVTASIAETITFSISDNTIGFGPLSASSSRYATGDGLGSGTETEAHNIVVGTNAANGYTMTVEGTTLTHSSGLYTVDAIGDTNTAPSSGSEQFGIRLQATGGVGEVAVPYAASGFALDTAGFPDELAFSDTSSADTTYSARYVGNIDSATEAGLYEAGLTYLATANF